MNYTMQSNNVHRNYCI
uniref:Uncharacterized protein n=1 Tax=Arundo donax TaxID=35708 RepID=A0A0A9A2F6_ARUDO